MKATATTTTPTAPQVSAADVARSLGRCMGLCLMFLLQCLAKAFGFAQRAVLSACQWLNSRHNYGFFPNLSNDIDQWPSRLFDSDETYQPAYLFCTLYYIVKAEYIATGETESLEYEACGRIRKDISVTSYMKDIKKIA